LHRFALSPSAQAFHLNGKVELFVATFFCQELTHVFQHNKGAS